MARGKTGPPHLVCETCGRESDHLRRDVLDRNHNAFAETPFWNCNECYQVKRQARPARMAGAEQGASGPWSS